MSAEIFRVIKLKAGKCGSRSDCDSNIAKETAKCYVLIKFLSKLKLSCLLAGGGAEHHRWQCFPHGVRGAASAPTDPSGCNLAAIDAVLSQGQAGASNIVGTFRYIEITDGD
jgi:hypothetical protein